jgi:Xaa-Pro aminopeptidase
MSFAQRRARFAQALEGSVAVIPAAAERLRNNDGEYEFRQDSDFYYLTGFTEPDAVLVLAPSRERDHAVLFLRPSDRSKEIWNGRRLGVERAPGELGVDAAYPIDEIDERLPEYLAGAERLYYRTGKDEAFDRRIHRALETARSLTRRKGVAPSAFVDPALILHEMRLTKSEDELATMRRAAAITKLGFVAGMGATRPGAYEYEIEALIEYTYFRNGAQAVAYPSIVAGGDNATTLHYNTNREPLAGGALLLVDSGCELDLYATDVTRTWPVNGRFSPEQRAIYEIVLAAQEAAIERVKPGERARAFHETALRVITEGLIDVGLLKGSVDENVERETYRDYYMHGAGHWLGLDVHDVGRYRDRDDNHRMLEPGMVTTVEPGIYVRRDLDCDDRFKGIGVRIEDDIAVSASGNENLTAAIPKSVADLESIVGSGAAAPA